MKNLGCIGIVLLLGLVLLLINPFFVHIVWNVLLRFAFPHLIFLEYWQRVAVGLALALLSNHND